VYRGKKKKEFLAKLPEKVVVWKVMEKLDGRYYPPFYANRAYQAGKNTTKAICANAGYKVAYHSFRQKHAAELWNNWPRHKVVRCIVPKKSITAVGTQWIGPVTGSVPVIVSTEIICPKYVGKTG
jgi:hypothetical protein